MTRTSRRTRLATAAVLAPLALGLVACGGDDDNDDVTTPAATSTATETPTTDDGATDDGATDDGATDDGATDDGATDDGATDDGATDDTTDGTATATGDAETAAQTALGEVDGTVFSIDVDAQGWDVSVVTADGVETDVELDPAAASVVRSTEDTENDADEAAERERLLGASVDYLAAIEAASAEVQGTVTGVDLSEDNGTAIWEVSFDEDTATEQTVDLDAESGDVLRVEQDD